MERGFIFIISEQPAAAATTASTGAEVIHSSILRVSSSPANICYILTRQIYFSAVNTHVPFRYGHQYWRVKSLSSPSYRK